MIVATEVPASVAQGGGTAMVSVIVRVVWVVDVAVRDSVVDSVIVGTNGIVSVKSVSVVDDVAVAST